MKNDEVQSLMCRAHGCPMKWSVQTGEVTACSYHAFEEPKMWPSITDRLIRQGPWTLPRYHDTHGTRDMKTRLRAGRHFESLDEKL